MNLLRRIVVLQFATTLALAQPAPQGKPPDLADQPESLVRTLYTQVVARHPLGLPSGSDEKISMPYLSKGLHHRIDLFQACDADWFRQHPEPNLKGPFGIWESGIFSGYDERAEPKAFHIQRTQSEKDGTVRVYVRLIWGTPPERPWIWHVEVILLREDNHYVVDDVVYLRDPKHWGPEDVDSRLSERLSSGCDGPRWVGHGDQPNAPKPH
jgi:hypothetical protein